MKAVQTRYSRFSDRHLFEDTEKRHSGRWAPRLYRIPIVVPALFVLTALAGWTIFVLLARLSGFHVTWWWPRPGSIPADQRGALVRDTLGILAVFGALLAGIYAYRKQRVEEAASHRSDAEGLSKRYQDAADQLGHDNAAVRLAGVYAMARLADEWPEQRQTCIDVLCAYLRMPWSTQSNADGGEIQVRSTIVGVISRHLNSESSVTSWREYRFDFSAARFIDLNFNDATFLTVPVFRQVTFQGESQFVGAKFINGADFDFARVDANSYLSLQDVVLESGRIQMTGLRVGADSQMDLCPAAIGGGSEIDIRLARIEGKLNIAVRPLSKSDGWILAESSAVINGGTLRVGPNLITEGVSLKGSPLVILNGWDIASGASVFLDQQLIDDDRLRRERWTVNEGAHVEVAQSPRIITFQSPTPGV